LLLVLGVNVRAQKFEGRAATPRIAATDPHVARMGRMEVRPDGGVRFSYPGVSFFLNFEGTRLSASVQASGEQNYLDVIVDGAARKLHLDQGAQTLVLAQGLAPGKHTAQIVNRTETWQGIATLQGFGTDGKWNAAPQLPAKRARRHGVIRAAPTAC
jgi:hypothetical protein